MRPRRSAGSRFDDAGSQASNLPLEVFDVGTAGLERVKRSFMLRTLGVVDHRAPGIEAIAFTDLRRNCGGEAGCREGGGEARPDEKSIRAKISTTPCGFEDELMGFPHAFELHARSGFDFRPGSFHLRSLDRNETPPLLAPSCLLGPLPSFLLLEPLGFCFPGEPFSLEEGVPFRVAPGLGIGAFLGNAPVLDLLELLQREKKRAVLRRSHRRVPPSGQVKAAVSRDVEPGTRARLGSRKQRSGAPRRAMRRTS
jgi:hypothetical protein